MTELKIGYHTGTLTLSFKKQSYVHLDETTLPVVENRKDQGTNYVVFADQIISALSIVEIRMFEVIKCKEKNGFCRKSLHFQR